jgi:hypothetical protein
VFRSRALFAFLLSELSDASKNTLLQQGGVMFDFEADKFEKSEQFDVILKILYINHSVNSSVPDEGYFRNVSCTLMLTSTFYVLYYTLSLLFFC